jgi:hypothetical protein
MRTRFHRVLEALTAALLFLPIVVFGPLITPGWGLGGLSISPDAAYALTGVMGVMAGLCYSHIYGSRYYLVYAVGMFTAAMGGLTLNSFILSKTDVIFKSALIISTLVGVTPGILLSQFLKKIQDAILPPSPAELARHRRIDEDRKWEVKSQQPTSVREIRKKMQYRFTVMVLFLLALIPPLGFIASLLVYLGNRNPWGYGRRVAISGMILSAVILGVYGLIYSYVTSLGSGNAIEKLGNKIASLTEIKKGAAGPNEAGPGARPKAGGRPGANDVDSLVDKLQHGQKWEKDLAVTELVMQADPKTASPQCVKAVAKALKQIAFDKTEPPGTRGLAIDGMAKWGGKFCVPLLVQLVDDPDDFVQVDCFRQLATFKDPSALDAIVRRFATDKINSQASSCLEAYGQNAETAVVKYLPEADKTGVKRLVEFLREYGTAKSIADLQSLRVRWMIFDFPVTTEIDRALAAIQAREVQPRIAP